jgi:hypothetical protein
MFFRLNNKNGRDFHERKRLININFSNWVLSRHQQTNDSFKDVFIRSRLYSLCDTCYFTLSLITKIAIKLTLTRNKR